MLDEIRIPINLRILCDNKAAISIAKIPVHHDMTKHVKIDHGIISVEHVSSFRQTRENIKSNLCMIEIYHPYWGKCWKSAHINQSHSILICTAHNKT